MLNDNFLSVFILEEGDSILCELRKLILNQGRGARVTVSKITAKIKLNGLRGRRSVRRLAMSQL